MIYEFRSADGEGLTEPELFDRYSEMLDEVNGDISIGTLKYSASHVLRMVDPIAFRVGFSDWLNSEIEDGRIEETGDDE
jgi:hypothetical protein